MLSEKKKKKERKTFNRINSLVHVQWWKQLLHVNGTEAHYSKYQFSHFNWGKRHKAWYTILNSSNLLYFQKKSGMFVGYLEHLNLQELEKPNKRVNNPVTICRNFSTLYGCLVLNNASSVETHHTPHKVRLNLVHVYSQFKPLNNLLWK